MINAQTLPYPKPLSAIQKTSRSLIVNFLSRLSFGALTLIESYQEEPSKRVMEFGQTGGLHAVIDVKDPDFYVRLLKGGSISAGEAYMDGWWDSPDLTTVIEVMALNLKTMDAMAKRNSLLARYPINGATGLIAIPKSKRKPISVPITISVMISTALF
ncbi:hypothetical protein QWZ16_15015 [Vibrio ostreicida]|uniref:Cyclopropane-fatty-acyl-phospholipid synthase n=1 Tax=Vibrio ostreicida TaxID=526588 RepID=A0ABT8BWG2_9VIBR|nr:hypothetical protein [Vibrio ostreicida]MDN3610993.1 hypothetical protein [Vibrio ostreicida]